MPIHPEVSWTYALPHMRLNNTQHTIHNTQHTTHNTQHTTHNTQHTTHNTQHTTHNNQQPTTNNQQPTTNNQQPTTNNQQPRTKNQQPTTNNQQTTNNKQQPQPHTNTHNHTQTHTTTTHTHHHHHHHHNTHTHHHHHNTHTTTTTHTYTPPPQHTQRRLRAFRRFVLWHSKMEVVAALHHSSGLRTSTAAQFSSTAVEPIAPRVVDSLPPAEEFTRPVYGHVHQEQFAAGEMSEKMMEFPVVQKQVFVQAILVVVGSLPPAEEFTGPVAQVHQEQLSASETTENIAEIPVVQEQVIVQAIPRVVGSLPPAEEFTGPVAQVHQEQLSASEMTVDIAEIPVVHQQVIFGMRPERLVDARGPQGGLERVRHSAVEPPIPGCVVLVQEPEAHDNTTTRYLLKKEEVDELLAISLQLRTPAQRARLHELISSSQARRRKRKKRRKRRLPRTSSRLSRCRKLWRFRSCSSSTLSSSSPFVPQRQILMVQTLQQTTEYPQLLYVSGGRCPCCAGPACHAVSTVLICTWLVFLVTLHLALCSCVFVWPKMLCITAGTHHAVAGLLATMLLALCSCSLSSGPRSSASWPV